MAVIAGQVIDMVQGMDVYIIHPVECTENCRNAAQSAAVIGDALRALLHGQSGCNRRHEQQNIFIFQDWAEIVPEHQLSG